MYLMSLGWGQEERKKVEKELWKREREVRKGRLDGWIHGWMGEWVDGPMNGRMDEQIKMNK